MKRYVPWLVIATLALLLSGSLAANGYLFALSNEYYTSSHEIRLDPLGLSYFSDKAITIEPNKPTAVFFGDSRAEQWPNPDGLEQIQFVNRGIGAQTSAQIHGRMQAHLRPLQPDIIILQLCINDLKTIPLFPEQKAQIVQNCQNNIQDIVEQAQAMDTAVILTTVFPVGSYPPERRLYWSNEINTAVTEVNEFIHTLEAESVLVLDAYALLEDGHGRLHPDFAADELHLNQTGYAQLNEALVALLDN